MSRHSSSSMSGANNVPLGSRSGTSSRSSSVGAGTMPPLGGATGGGGGGSLLKPAYLQQGGGSSSSSGGGGGGLGAIGGILPQFSSISDDDKKMQALQTILNFNAEQARKRAASSGGAGGGGGSSNGSSGGSGEKRGHAAAADSREGRDGSSDRKKKRKSRWGGGEDDKTFIPGMPTMMPQGLSKEQEEAYLLQLKIEDTSRRLRSGDYGIPTNPDERSPSPEPIYSSDGKRMNTREYRKRKELEETRHEAITRMLQINVEYKPPPDYKPPQIKVNDKVMIPQDEHPDINFVGLLIGPRGNTLKALERETGGKIIIRGKGSVKEGKVGRKDGQPLPGEDEPLHAYVTATNPEAVKRAVDRIKDIIRQAVEIPEGQNDLRRNQLRELALLNGTLREGDGLGGGPRCSNCGASDHKSWQCQDKPNVTNNIVCTACGGVGHIARDCGQKRPGMGGFGNETPGMKNKMDDEYMSLMAELGEGPPPAPSSSKPGWQQGQHHRQPPPPGGASNLFGRPQAPRPLMGPRAPQPPPPPPGEYGGPPPGGSGSSWGGGKQQHWQQQQQRPSQQQQGGWNQAPPPPPGQGPTSAGHWGGQQQSQQQQQHGYGMPPPPHHAYMGGPPPPPPPGGASSSSSSSASWGAPPPPPPQSSAWGGGPPPPPGTPQAASGGRGGAPQQQQQPYWQQPQHGWGGQVPPQPVAPPSMSGGISLSNILSAPPPPPPPK